MVCKYPHYTVRHSEIHCLPSEVRLKSKRCSCVDLSGCVFCLRVTNCVCVRALKFPVKIPVIHRRNTPCCLSVCGEDPGGVGRLTCLILLLPAPCETRMCQLHTSSRCSRGCLCVRSTGPYIHGSYRCPIWIHTTVPE